MFGPLLAVAVHVLIVGSHPAVAPGPFDSPPTAGASGSPKLVKSLPVGLSNLLVFPPIVHGEDQQPRRISTRIIGGSDAVEGRFPYVVYLSGAGFLCGGSLVAPDAVLTAGHCVNFNKAYIALEKANTWEEHDVIDDVPHPEYTFDQVPDRDFRLLRLRTRSAVTPVLLDDGAVFSGLAASDRFSILGWGLTSTDAAAEQTASSTLQYAEVAFVPQEDSLCSQGGLVTEAMICGYEAGRDACRGDSGGPMLWLQDEKDQDVQVGVISWGQGCAAAGYPGVYATVTYAIEWIDSVLEDWGSARRVSNRNPDPEPETPSPTQLQPGVELSERCCSELPWFHDAAGHRSVCSATNFRRKAIPADAKPLPCTYNVTHAQAQDVCAGAGARLCSLKEIERGEVLNTGCIVNFRQVWTSTTCEGGGFFTALGTGWGKRCQKPNVSDSMVACCADSCKQ